MKLQDYPTVKLMGRHSLVLHRVMISTAVPVTVCGIVIDPAHDPMPSGDQSVCRECWDSVLEKHHAKASRPSRAQAG